VELARRLVGGYPDGVWLVELAALRDPALLGEVVAATLGLGGEPAEPGAAPPGTAERLATLVADKGLLVVLDNCEHLAAACAGLVRELLEAGPGLRVLATSREVLGVPGEAIWPIPPLGVPAPAHAGPAVTDSAEGPAGRVAVNPAAVPDALARYDAVRLFADRATTADPSFTLDAAGAPVVAELCRRLDGLPLAIELAAARVRFMSPAEIAARLDDRFRLLAGGDRTADPRQQTLRATIDWSWDLLAEPDRWLWRRLSVFSGGWTIAAAEAVCSGDGLDPGEVLEGLFRLVDRSLVVPLGGEPARFGLLESLRAYGAERLAEAAEAGAVEARHTAWCLDLAEQSGHGNDEAWQGRIEADYDNLRAAMDRAVAAPDPETALRLAGGLGWYWAGDHHDEGRRRIEAALALASGEPPTPALARALQALALVDVLLGPGPATLDAARRSLELFERFGDRHGAAMSKLVLGQAERQVLGRGDTAGLFEEAEATFQELGDRWGEAYAQSARFAAEAYFGEPARAFALAGQALDGFRAVGDQRGRAWLLFVLGMAARFRGQLDEATDRYQEALAAARQAGPLWVTCSTLVELGSLAALEGEDARADELHAEAAALARRSGLRRGTAHVSNEVGLVARARGHPEQALPLHRQALAIHRAQLPTRVPRTLGQLGCTEARLGDLDAAEAHLREAANLVLATPQPPTAALLLVGFARVAAGRGDPELAARLLGAAAATRDRFGVPAAGAEQDEADLAGQAAAAALTPEAFQAATAAGRALAPDQALRLALG
jgi:predicted ATPase